MEFSRPSTNSNHAFSQFIPFRSRFLSSNFWKKKNLHFHEIVYRERLGNKGRSSLPCSCHWHNHRSWLRSICPSIGREQYDVYSYINASWSYRSKSLIPEHHSWLLNEKSTRIEFILKISCTSNTDYLCLRKENYSIA